MMGRLRDRLAKDKLERLYVLDGLSKVQIAERVGSNRESVRKLLLQYGIELRKPGYPFSRRR
jgi:DNA-binding transcriptional regulator LsrR (DeoR family)